MLYKGPIHDPNVAKNKNDPQPEYIIQEKSGQIGAKKNSEGNQSDFQTGKVCKGKLSSGS